MKLKEYQNRIVDFIEKTPNCILSVDMGLGKTASLLSWLNQSNTRTCCIVAPKRVALTVWRQEAEKWGFAEMANKMVIVCGTPAKRKKALDDSTKPFKIVSRDNLKDIQQHKFDVLIIDELTTFKSVDSNRFKYIATIDAYRKIGLTGTFLANGAIDVYGQALAVGLELGRNFYSWRASYFRDTLAGSGLQFHKWQLCVTIDELLAPIKNNIFTLSSADYLEIPKVSEYTHEIELHHDEIKQYNDLNSFLQFECDGENIVFSDKEKFFKLQTLCDGFVYDEGVAKRGEYLTKLNAVADFVETCHEKGEHVLLFYSFVEEAKILCEMLQQRGIVIDSAKSNGFFERWNSGKTDCLFAHPASAGHGLNLQHGGRILVWSSLTYNFEYFAQANARLARTGQTKNVQIHYFVAKDTCEKNVCRALTKKRKDQNDFIELTKC